MEELRRTFLVAVAVAVGAPGLGAAWQGFWPLALLFLGLGILWRGARDRRWLAGTSTALCIGGIALAAWLDVGMAWLVVGMTGALAAWDLDAFGVRLRGASHVENERGLVRAHLGRLGAVSGVGLLLGTGALLIRLQLSFAAALIMASLAVLGTALVTYRLSRVQEDESDHVSPSA